MSQQYKSSNLDPDQDPDLAPQPLLLLGLPQPVLHVLLSKLSSQDKVTLMRTCHQTRLAVLLTAPTIRVSIQDDMPGKEANTSLVSLVANRKQPLHLVLELAKTSDEGTSVILEKIATSHQGAAAAGGSSGHNCVRELTHQLNHWDGDEPLPVYRRQHFNEPPPTASWLGAVGVAFKGLKKLWLHRESGCFKLDTAFFAGLAVCSSLSYLEISTDLDHSSPCVWELGADVVLHPGLFRAWLPQVTELSLVAHGSSLVPLLKGLAPQLQVLKVCFEDEVPTQALVADFGTTAPSSSVQRPALPSSSTSSSYFSTTSARCCDSFSDTLAGVLPTCHKLRRVWLSQIDDSLLAALLPLKELKSVGVGSAPNITDSHSPSHSHSQAYSQASQPSSSKASAGRAASAVRHASTWEELRFDASCFSDCDDDEQPVVRVAALARSVAVQRVVIEGQLKISVPAAGDADGMEALRQAIQTLAGVQELQWTRHLSVHAHGRTHTAGTLTHGLQMARAGQPGPSAAVGAGSQHAGPLSSRSPADSSAAAPQNSHHLGVPAEDLQRLHATFAALSPLANCNRPLKSLDLRLYDLGAPIGQLTAAALSLTLGESLECLDVSLVRTSVAPSFWKGATLPHLHSLRLDVWGHGSDDTGSDNDALSSSTAVSSLAEFVAAYKGRPLSLEVPAPLHADLGLPATSKPRCVVCLPLPSAK